MAENIFIHTLEELPKAAREFIDKIGDRRVIAFDACMGGGKTTFITALCKELGVLDTVCSPTFTIINEYATESGRSIYHFDFYRLEKLSEAMDIGIEEYLESDGLCLMEWAEKVEELLPDDTLHVNINVLEDGTRVLEF